MREPLFRGAPCELVEIRLMAIHDDDRGLKRTSQDERLPARPATQVEDDGSRR